MGMEWGLVGLMGRWHTDTCWPGYRVNTPAFISPEYVEICMKSAEANVMLIESYTGN